jgi:hypothetical protein
MDLNLFTVLLLFALFASPEEPGSGRPTFTEVGGPVPPAQSLAWAGASGLGHGTAEHPAPVQAWCGLVREANGR